VNPHDQQGTFSFSKGPTAKLEASQTVRLYSHGTQASSPHFNLKRTLPDHGESDPTCCALELVQRGRLILDVSAVDLEASEATLGAFHPTTWHFRQSFSEAQRSWERLEAEIGTKLVKTALKLPPLTTLRLTELTTTRPEVVVFLINGQTYRPERVIGTELAPIQWRLNRLRPPLDNGPYYICRLADGSTQCDCANWTYQIAQTTQSHESRCKHIEALQSLGWI
jgi:hypothetical protein